MNNPKKKRSHKGDAAHFAQEPASADTARLAVLNRAGNAMASQKDVSKLLSTFLQCALEATASDAGTIYRACDNELVFEALENQQLGISKARHSGAENALPPVSLRHPDGSPNVSNVSAYCANSKSLVNIKDAYTEPGFDFSGTKAFDSKTGYRCKSFLCIPLTDHRNDILGVLQLINCKNAGQAYGANEEIIATSLAAQAASAMENRMLVQQLEDLFEALVRLINNAIDEKSPYTAGHCQRVPELAMALISGAAADPAAFPSYNPSPERLYETRIACLLHDCGKITTPIHVVDKATKLDGIFDKIDWVQTRMESLGKDFEIAALREAASGKISLALAQKRINENYKKLEQDMAFLRKANIGDEFMQEADRQRVSAIASLDYKSPLGRCMEPLLTQQESENLRVRRGTLNDAERSVINQHIVSTIAMLESLPWPAHLACVPEIAGGHHERMDGKGYPKGLTKDQMPLEARAIGIADIFEALTAKDRPYKRGFTLSEALSIMSKMAREGHIDPDLFKLFALSGIWKDYAQRFMDPNQIDAVDVHALLSAPNPPQEEGL